MKSVVFIASFILMASQANAETYKTSFVAPNNVGQPYNTGMVVDLNFAEKYLWLFFIFIIVLIY